MLVGMVRETNSRSCQILITCCVSTVTDGASKQWPLLMPRHIQGEPTVGIVADAVNVHTLSQKLFDSLILLP